jgi:hypothetical protein
MSRVTRAAKATYNFFAGDAIILTAVLVAFVVAALLARLAGVPNALIAVGFVALIVAGLVLTLSRELVGRPK